MSDHDATNKCDVVICLPFLLLLVNRNGHYNLLFEGKHDLENILGTGKQFFIAWLAFFRLFTTPFSIFTASPFSSGLDASAAGLPEWFLPPRVRARNLVMATRQWRDALNSPRWGNEASIIHFCRSSATWPIQIPVGWFSAWQHCRLADRRGWTLISTSRTA